MSESTAEQQFESFEDDDRANTDKVQRTEILWDNGNRFHTTIINGTLLRVVLTGSGATVTITDQDGIVLVTAHAAGQFVPVVDSVFPVAVAGELTINVISGTSGSVIFYTR